MSNRAGPEGPSSTTGSLPSAPGGPGGSGRAPLRGDWSTRHLWEIQPIRDSLVLLAIVGVIYLGYVLSVVTVPLLIAMALAYLFEPVVRWLTNSGYRRYVSRQGAALLLIVAAVVFIAVPIATGLTLGVIQGVKFAREQSSNVLTLVKSVENEDDLKLKEALPGPRWQWMRTKLIEYKKQAEDLEAQKAQQAAEAAAAHQAHAGTPASGGAPVGTTPAPPTGPNAPGGAPTGGTLAQAEPGSSALPPRPDRFALDSSDPMGVTVYKMVRHAGDWLRQRLASSGDQALDTGAKVIGWVLGTLGSIAFLLFQAFLTAFFFFFICVSWGKVLAFWESLIPERKRTGFVEVMTQMDLVIAGFIRGRLIICGIMACFYTLAFFLIGAPAPLILGPVFGAAHLIPYAAALSVPVTALLMAVEPSSVGWQSAWYWVLIGPVVVYLLGQVMDDYILTPTIAGRTTNMDTPTILFASLAGGILGGFYGLLIAIPTSACIKIVMARTVWPRIRAWGEGRAADPLPISGGNFPTIAEPAKTIQAPTLPPPPRL